MIAFAALRGSKTHGSLIVPTQRSFALVTAVG